MSVINVTRENYEKEILQSKKPVLIDFWASWCGPCKMLSPIIDEIAEEITTIKVVKVNVDEHPELAQRLNVMSIPTLLYMKEGLVQATSIGLKSKKDILNLISK